MSGEALDTSANWLRLAGTSRQEGPAATADLYSSLTAPIRARMSRVVGPEDLDDSLHEVVVIILGAIRREKLRDPERLACFVNTIARRRMVAHVRSRMLQRRLVDGVDVVASPDRSPEESAAHQERVEQLARVLRRLNPRDREILERFYFNEQNHEQICREMRLTETQFRLFKSRAIARCFELASRPPPRPLRRSLRQPF